MYNTLPKQPVCPQKQQKADANLKHQPLFTHPDPLMGRGYLSVRALGARLDSSPGEGRSRGGVEAPSYEEGVGVDGKYAGLCLQKGGSGGSPLKKNKGLHLVQPPLWCFKWERIIRNILWCGSVPCPDPSYSSCG